MIGTNPLLRSIHLKIEQEVRRRVRLQQVMAKARSDARAEEAGRGGRNQAAIKGENSAYDDKASRQSFAASRPGQAGRSVGVGRGRGRGRGRGQIKPPGGGALGALAGRFGKYGKTLEDLEAERLSYEKLIKAIEIKHPCDPDTKQKFSISDRITIKNFGPKLMDIFYCLIVYEYYLKVKRVIRRRFFKVRKQKFEKPAHLKELEGDSDSDGCSSSSSSDEDAGQRGLTVAAQHLGEGAALYLQSMKTIAIMFTVLTILNIPILYMYSSQTSHNNYQNLTELPKYFTIGNLGRTDSECDYSEVYLGIDTIVQATEMEKITLSCPTGSYISELKNFGFLHWKDRKTNDESHGYGQCQSSMHPLAPPVNANYAEYEDEIQEYKDDKEAHFEAVMVSHGIELEDEGDYEIQAHSLEADDSSHPSTSSSDTGTARRLSSLEPAPDEGSQEIQSIPEHLRDIIKINKEPAETISSHYAQRMALANDSKRSLEGQEGGYVFDMDESKCLQCLRNERQFCTDLTNLNQGVCCDDQSAVDEGLCSSANFEMTCTEEGSSASTLPSSGVPSLFKKALCPNNPKCGQDAETRKVINFISYQKVVLEYDPQEFISNDEEHCSYWIKPPKTINENDFLDIKITNIAEESTTIFIVQQDPNGEITYLPGREFKPKTGITYSFLLQKAQYTDDIAELAAEAELRQDGTYQYQESEPYMTPYHVQMGQSTSYSLLLVVEGKEGAYAQDPTEQMEVALYLQEGFVKPIQDAFRIPEEEYDHYNSRNFAPVWARVKALEAEIENNGIQARKVEDTSDNVDPWCQYQPSDEARQSAFYRNYKSQSTEKSLFRSIEYQNWFTEYFQSKCGHRQHCQLNPSWIRNCEGLNCNLDNPFEEDEHYDEVFDYEDYDQDLNILPKISESCLRGMLTPGQTSTFFVAVVGCRDDMVRFPFTSVEVHKEQAGIVIVSFDIASIIIMALFFSKLQSINREYLEIMDDRTVQMKDFTVKLDDLVVDKYTQDSRALKMKIWLHFTEILKNKRTLDNDFEVLDVTLSLYTQKNIQAVFQMQHLQIQANEINANARARVYSEGELDKKLEQLKVIQEKLKKLKEQYRLLANLRDKTKANTKRISKQQRIAEIQYVFIVFKDSLSAPEVLEMFKKDIFIVKVLKRLCKKGKEATKNKQFQGQDLKVSEALDPDEIIWQNLAYDKTAQRYRSYVIRLLAILFTVLMILVTLYLNVLDEYLTLNIPSSNCPEYWLKEWPNPDPEDADYKKQAFDDYKLYLDNPPDADDLMGCYCSRHAKEPWALFTRRFKDESYPRGAAGRMACLEVKGLQVFRDVVLGLVTTMGPLLNEFVAFIFSYLGKFLKKHTKEEEQETSFVYVFILEFINIGLIQLMISQIWFQVITDAFIGFTKGSIGMGEDYHHGFVPAWYMDKNAGRAICVFIFMSPFISNTKHMKEFVKLSLLRLYDRGFSLNRLKKDPDDEGDDRPNTKQKVQSKLEQLYTGRRFRGEEAYSRMMSIIFCILLYSSGMPILYAVGVVLYTFTYFAHKVLITQFYQKSRTLTRTIPLISMKLIKAALLVHIIGGAFIFADKEGFVSRERDSSLAYFNPVASAQEAEQELIHDGESVVHASVGYYEYFHQQLYLIFIITFLVLYVMGKTLKGLLFVTLRYIARKLQKLWKAIKRHFSYTQNKVFLQDEAAQNKYISSEESASQSLSQSLESLFDSDHECSENELAARSQGSLRTEQRRLDPQENQVIRKMFQEEKYLVKYEKYLQVLEQKDQMRKRQLQKRRKREDYSENILKELSCENLSNFYERAQQELHDFLDFFNLEKDERITSELREPDSDHPKAVVFTEICYLTRISSEDAYKYQRFLLKRIRQIEEVIDSHFELIKEAVLQKIKDGFAQDRKRLKEGGYDVPLSQMVNEMKNEENHLQELREMFDDYWYPKDYKIQYLADHQDALIDADKRRKDNRGGGSEIVRMTGSLTQSYFIFDCQEFKVARQLYYSLDQEDAALKVDGVTGPVQYRDERQDAHDGETEGVDDSTESKFTARSAKTSNSAKRGTFSSRSRRSAKSLPVGVDDSFELSGAGTRPKPRKGTKKSRARGPSRGARVGPAPKKKEEFAAAAAASDDGPPRALELEWD